MLDETEKNAGAPKKHRGYLVRCPNKASWISQSNTHKL